MSQGAEIGRGRKGPTVHWQESRFLIAMEPEPAIELRRRTIPTRWRRGYPTETELGTAHSRPPPAYSPVRVPRRVRCRGTPRREIGRAHSDDDGRERGAQERPRVKRTHVEHQRSAHPRPCLPLTEYLPRIRRSESQRLDTPMRGGISPGVSSSGGPARPKLPERRDIPDCRLG